MLLPLGSICLLFIFREHRVSIQIMPVAAGDRASCNLQKSPGLTTMISCRLGHSILTDAADPAALSDTPAVLDQECCHRVDWHDSCTRLPLPSNETEISGHLHSSMDTPPSSLADVASPAAARSEVNLEQQKVYVGVSARLDSDAQLGKERLPASIEQDTPCPVSHIDTGIDPSAPIICRPGVRQFGHGERIDTAKNSKDRYVSSRIEDDRICPSGAVETPLLDGHRGQVVGFRECSLEDEQQRKACCGAVAAALDACFSSALRTKVQRVVAHAVVCGWSFQSQDFLEALASELSKESHKLAAIAAVLCQRNFQEYEERDPGSADCISVLFSNLGVLNQRERSVDA